jgi:hypothetical protein
LSGDRGNELPEQRRSREDRRLSLPATNGVGSITAAPSRVRTRIRLLSTGALSGAKRKRAGVSYEPK